MGVADDSPWKGVDVYGASKLLMHVVSLIQAKEISGSGVVVNTVCPGFVKTRLGGSMAQLTASQGAEVIVELARREPATLDSGLFWTHARVEGALTLQAESLHECLDVGPKRVQSL